MSLAKNSAFNIVYNILNLLFPLITSMYVARILLPAGVGQVSYAQNIVSYFIIFASLGLPTYGVREIAKAKNDAQQTNRTFTQLLVINFASTLISSVAFMILLFANEGLKAETPLFLCCSLQLILNFVNIDWFYRGKEEYSYIVCRSIIIKLLSIFAIFLFVHSAEDYIIYALISSVAACGNYIFNIFHVRKYVKLDFSEFKIAKHMQPIFILAITILLSGIYSKLDITMLGSITTDTETGLYTNANHIIAIITGICASISAVFLPRLSYYYNSEKTEFFSLVKLGTRILSFICIPMSVGLYLLAPQAISLVYGDAFAQAVTTIRILCALIVIKSFGDLLCYQMAISTGNEKGRVPAYIAAAVLNIILNALLIPKIGRNGAAIASVASELVLNLQQFIKLKKLVNYELDIKALLQSVFTTAIMAVCILLVCSLKLNSLLTAVLAIVLGGSVYIILNLILKNEFLLSVIGKLKQKVKH